MLEVSSLCAGYGEINVLRNVSIHLDQGEIVALLGANNAGKSTLINSLTGILKNISGRMTYDGVDFTGWSSNRILNLGISQVPEGRLVFPEMSIRDNLLVGGVLTRARPGRAKRLEWVLDVFPRLGERLNQTAGTLSGGEQQMLAIGRALMADPKVLLLDEPSLGLAPLIVTNIFRALRKLNESGLTILLVEQNLNLALAHASRCYILEHGSVVLEGSSQELKNDPRTHRAYLGL